MNNKYILIASNGKGAGKSVFSNNLEQELKYKYNTLRVNFADQIREDVFYLLSKHTNLTVEDLKINYNNIKDDNYNFNSELDATFILRTLINKYSLFMSEFFPGPLWGLAYYNKTITNQPSVVITDDLRRHQELEFLLEKVGKENVFLIYLEKDDLEIPQEKSFEGHLNPEIFDLHFKFDPNWENSTYVLEKSVKAIMEFLA